MASRDALPSGASPLPWRVTEKGVIVDARGLHVAQASAGTDAAFIVARCNATAILASGQSGGQKHTTTVANSPGIPDSSILASGQSAGQNGGQIRALLDVCEERRKHWKGVRSRASVGWHKDDASAREQTWGYVESLVGEIVASPEPAAAVPRSGETTVDVLRGIVAQLDSNIRDLREAQGRANEVACKRLGSEIVGIKIARACVVDEIERLEGK